MSAAISGVRAVDALPLDFVGRLRILRTMHLPAALHGAEASLVSISGSRRLRAAFCQAALSGGLRLANPGAVLSLLDVPVGSDPGFYVVWCRFRMLRGHMAYNSSVHELARVYSLLRVVSAGAPGHGLPVLCLLGFLGIRTYVFGSGLVYLLFVRSGRYLDFRGSLKLLSSPHQRGGDKGLCVGLYLGVFGMDFFLASSKKKSFLVVSVGVLIMMDICFGSALILLLFTFVKVPNFVDLLLRDRSSWPRCLLWHGWLLASLCWWGFSLGCHGW